MGHTGNLCMQHLLQNTKHAAHDVNWSITLSVSLIPTATAPSGVDATSAQAGTIRGTAIGSFDTDFADNGLNGGASKQTVDYRWAAMVGWRKCLAVP